MKTSESYRPPAGPAGIMINRDIPQCTKSSSLVQVVEIPDGVTVLPIMMIAFSSFKMIDRGHGHVTVDGNDSESLAGWQGSDSRPCQPSAALTRRTAGAAAARPGRVPSRAGRGGAVPVTVARARPGRPAAAPEPRWRTMRRARSGLAA